MVGAVLFVVGFLITIGVVGYMMTLRSYELDEQKGSILIGLAFGGFISLVGSMSFFYGLADYIVTKRS